MTTHIEAKVISGRGKATKLRAKDVDALSKLLNIELVDGSLNLVSKKPLWLDAKFAIFISDNGHTYWHATLNDIPVILNRLKANYPAHIYEIYATIKLRKALSLHDGSKVYLRVANSIIDGTKSKNLKFILTWYFIWFGREKLYYTSDSYLHWLRHRIIRRHTGRALQ